MTTIHDDRYGNKTCVPLLCKIDRIWFFYASEQGSSGFQQEYDENSHERYLPVQCYPPFNNYARLELFQLLETWNVPFSSCVCRVIAAFSNYCSFPENRATGVTSLSFCMAPKMSGPLCVLGDIVCSYLKGSPPNRLCRWYVDQKTPVYGALESIMGGSSLGLVPSLRLS